jgi:hypothetical protein
MRHDESPLGWLQRFASLQNLHWSAASSQQIGGKQSRGRTPYDRDRAVLDARRTTTYIPPKRRDHDPLNLGASG